MLAGEGVRRQVVAHFFRDGHRVAVGGLLDGDQHRRNSVDAHVVGGRGNSRTTDTAPTLTPRAASMRICEILSALSGRFEVENVTVLALDVMVPMGWVMASPAMAWVTCWGLILYAARRSGLSGTWNWRLGAPSICTFATPSMRSSWASRSFDTQSPSS